MIVNSLNSYGYNSLNGYMFGPVFGSAERTTYNGASGSGDCPAAPSGYRCIDLAD